MPFRSTRVQSKPAASSTSCNRTSAPPSSGVTDGAADETGGQVDGIGRRIMRNAPSRCSLTVAPATAPDAQLAQMWPKLHRTARIARGSMRLCTLTRHAKRVNASAIIDQRKDNPRLASASMSEDMVSMSRRRAIRCLLRPGGRKGRHGRTVGTCRSTMNASAMQMAQTIFGDGVTVVVGELYRRPPTPRRIYSATGYTTSPGVAARRYRGDPVHGRRPGLHQLSWWAGNNSNQSSSTSTNTGGSEQQLSDFNAAAGATDLSTRPISTSDFIPDRRRDDDPVRLRVRGIPRISNLALQRFRRRLVERRAYPVCRRRRAATSVTEINPTATNINLYRRQHAGPVQHRDGRVHRHHDPDHSGRSGAGEHDPDRHRRRARTRTTIPTC